MPLSCNCAANGMKVLRTSCRQADNRTQVSALALSRQSFVICCQPRGFWRLGLDGPLPATISSEAGASRRNKRSRCLRAYPSTDLHDGVRRAEPDMKGYRDKSAFQRSSLFSPKISIRSSGNGRECCCSSEQRPVPPGSSLDCFCAEGDRLKANSPSKGKVLGGRKR